MDCAICLQAVGASSVTLQCNHVFHSTCLSIWAQESYTCPMCRSLLEVSKCFQSKLFKVKLLSRAHCFETAFQKLHKINPQKEIDNVYSQSLIQKTGSDELKHNFKLVVTKNIHLEVKLVCYDIILDVLLHLNQMNVQEAKKNLGLSILANPYLCKTRLVRATLLQRCGKFNESLRDLNVVLRKEPKKQTCIENEVKSKSSK